MNKLEKLSLYEAIARTADLLFAYTGDGNIDLTDIYDATVEANGQETASLLTIGLLIADVLRDEGVNLEDEIRDIVRSREEAE